MADRIVERIRHAASIVDADDVSRTGRTLDRMADVIEAEFGVGRYGANLTEVLADETDDTGGNGPFGF